MLTDVALNNLKPKAKPCKVADRDGMYAHVAPSGRVTFRIDYRLNGRRETLLLGGYGPARLSLARAREKCIVDRRAPATALRVRDIVKQFLRLQGFAR